MTPDAALRLGIATLAFALLPALALLVLPRRGKTTTRLRILAAFAVTVLAMRVGAWPYASVHLQNVGGLALLVGSLGAGVRGRLVNAPRTPIEGGLYGVVGAVGLALLAWAFKASWFTGPAVELYLPLPPGSYCVLQGGASALAAPRIEPGAGGERAGLEIVRTGSLGNRGNVLVPRALDEHASFGAKITAPCEGEVVGAEGALPDQPAGAEDRAHPSGNYVLLACPGALVKLAYLKQGSVRVAAGKRVKPGQEVGAMGSSGAAGEPKLGLGAFASDAGVARALAGQGDLPMRFDGHVLVTNTSFTME